MWTRRTQLLAGLLILSLLAVGALTYGLRQTLTGGGQEVSPWLFCTTTPCQPLGLFALPTPPALTHEGSQAAACDFSARGAGDGILLWHTDWDPRTEKGRCASSEEAAMLGAK